VTLTDATKDLKQVASEIEENESKNYQGLTVVIEQLLQRNDQGFKVMDVRMKSIEDSIAGKSTLSKAADTVKDALHLGKSEEA